MTVYTINAAPAEGLLCLRAAAGTQQAGSAATQAASNQQQSLGVADPGEVEKYPDSSTECHTMEFTE
jgi:hypothetical protein